MKKTSKQSWVSWDVNIDLFYFKESFAYLVKSQHSYSEIVLFQEQIQKIQQVAGWGKGVCNWWNVLG